MQWLNKIVDELVERHPEGEIIVSSGVSPSGTYHLGTLREVLTAEVILRELNSRGRQARHLHVVDDLDVFRKVPVDVPDTFKQYLGKPLCDVPSPDKNASSYADYFLEDLLKAADGLHLDMEVIRSHQKYREGFFVSTIETALGNIEAIKQILENISGRSLDQQWSPVQIIEDGYLKNRKFISLDEQAKQISYEDSEGKQREISYADGQVKLSWRIDWPARWSLLGVHAEPFGRDHATKGGSYDSGAEIARKVFKVEPPLPVPYDFINKTGETKKMSKSAGDTITAAELLKILPPELVWFFVIRYSPDKLLFFDAGPTLIRLFDEFSELLNKPDKTSQEVQLLRLCLQNISEQTVSRVPFSHLVASYQAALKDSNLTLDVMRRTEYQQIVDEDQQIIKNELKFIDQWLQNYAPEEVVFSLSKNVELNKFNETQKQFMSGLADKIVEAPDDADGAWFHQAIYEFKEGSGMPPKELFETLYQATIGKNSGPRAGWFLSLLPRDWLVSRLKLEA